MKTMFQYDVPELKIFVITPEIEDQIRETFVNKQWGLKKKKMIFEVKEGIFFDKNESDSDSEKTFLICLMRKMNLQSNDGIQIPQNFKLIS